MLERTSQYETIKNIAGVTLATVLISPSSKVVYNLMSDHYIQLDFVLESAIHFPVGSYISDAIFGKFYLTEEQMPKYDDKTGGYKYELKFEAWYKLWNLKQVCLTTTLTTSSSGLNRKETSWTLTANLKEHLRSFMYNLMALGFITTCDLTDDDVLDNFIDIDTDNIDDAYNALTVSYSGTYCIDALKSLADTFSCEYWIEGNEADFHVGNGNAKICFGKIEIGEEIDLTLNDNVESMDINQDSSNKGDIIRAFGATTNVPYTYRKNVYATVHKIDSTTYCFQVPNIISGDKGFLDPVWFDTGNSSVDKITLLSACTQQLSYDADDEDYSEEIAVFDTITDAISIVNGECTISLSNMPSVKSWEEIDMQGDYSGSIYVTASVALVDEDSNASYSLLTASITKTIRATGSVVAAIDQCLNNLSFNQLTISELSANNYCVKTRIAVDFSGLDLSSEEYAKIQTKCENCTIDVSMPDIVYSFAGNSQNTLCRFYYNDNHYAASMNVYGRSRSSAYKRIDDRYYQCVFSDVALSEGDTIRIDDYGIIDIPLSYYTQPYENPSSVLQIGENRLCLPDNQTAGSSTYWDDPDNPQFVCKNGVIVPYAYVGNVDAWELKEITVAFDKIYPDGKLQIAEIYTTNEKDVTDTEGEAEKYRWDYLRYYVKVVLADSSKSSTPFKFDANYILDGKELELRFIVPNDLKDITTAEEIDETNGCKLCGMQFQADFNKKLSSKTIYDKDGKACTDVEQLYTIVRNADFGCSLPNNTLCPTVGDPLVVQNWNVKAMMNLGLIDNAEKRLMKKAFEYAHALKDGNFTFTCNMMSSFFFDLYGEYISLGDVNNNNLVESGGAYLYVKNGFDVFAIPQLGQKVCINHDALAESKHTRVIGYEYKLDKPYDSPKLTCGESEAYSRLKQMEKEITKLS